MRQKPPVPDAGYPSGNPVGTPSGMFRARRRRVRRGNWRLTLTLLAVWALVTFGVAYFARALSFDFFGWPFSFWVGSQGALIVYVAIVVIYAVVMNRREAAAGVQDPAPFFDEVEAKRPEKERSGPITGF
jgi:putative solute:sodium symporter small subunit